MDGQEQVREIYAASAGRLVAQVYALIGDFAEAQDVVHEAFARVLDRPGRLARLDNPEAWLRTVAVNLARSRHRRRAVFERLVRAGRLEQTAAAVPGISPDHVPVPTRARTWTGPQGAASCLISTSPACAVPGRKILDPGSPPERTLTVRG